MGRLGFLSGTVPVFRSEGQQLSFLSAILPRPGEGDAAGTATGTVLGLGCTRGWCQLALALVCRATALPPFSHTRSCAVASGTDVVWMENNSSKCRNLRRGATVPAVLKPCFIESYSEVLFVFINWILKL